MTMNASNTVNRPSVGETNGLVNGIAYHNDRHSQDEGIKTVCWTAAGLEITRLRLLSDQGYPFWDVSYCHGVLNGVNVDVRLPFSQLPKRNTKSWLYNEAKATGGFIKGLFSAFSSMS
jgi:hypothetical protein